MGVSILTVSECPQVLIAGPGFDSYITLQSAPDQNTKLELKVKTHETADEHLSIGERPHDPLRVLRFLSRFRRRRLIGDRGSCSAVVNLGGAVSPTLRFEREESPLMSVIDTGEQADLHVTGDGLIGAMLTESARRLTLESGAQATFSVSHVATAGTVVLLHSPLTSVGVSIRDREWVSAF